MKDIVLILLIIGLVMLVLGIAMIIATVRFVLRKEHPLLAIVFAIFQCPCIYIPINFTIGYVVARITLIATSIYGIVMIILTLRNLKHK